MIKKKKEKKYAADELSEILKVKSTENFNKYIRLFKESPLLNNFLFTGNSYFLIYNLSTLQVLYASPGLKAVTGYLPHQFETGGIEFIFSTFHPDYVISQKQIHAQMVEFHNSVPLNERLKYRYNQDFQLKRADGQFIWLLSQLQCIRMDELGNPLLAMDILTDITRFKRDNIQTHAISHYNEKDGFVEVCSDFMPELINGIVTDREAEIINCIKQGLSSKEIANKLNISLNTVNTHRRNILKKHII